MNKKPGICSHSYDEALEGIHRHDKRAHLSPDAEFPFTMTHFELMPDNSRADYPHRHDCYEVLYVLEGEGTHIIDFEPFPVAPNTFYFLAKDQVHFWQLTKPLKGYALLFREEFLGFPSSNLVRSHDFTFFDQAGLAPHLHIEPKHRPRVSSLLDEMEEEFHNETTRSVSVLRAYLHILLSKLHRLYSAEIPHEHSGKAVSLVRQFKQLVAQHFIAEQSVNDYADRIGVSTSHLRDTVKAVTGLSPGQHIRQRLILEAKRMLAHDNVSVADIGYQLNFDDPSYFGRFIKRETGLSPIAFRQQIRDKYRIHSQ